jgi:exodeoxyribonuclease-3
MKVITVNVNGIRSAAKKGLFSWLETQNADVICLQEIKAEPHQIEAEVEPLPGYTRYFFSAEKKGYSGVGLYCKTTPLDIKTGLGWECADREGRYIQADFANVSIVSLYLPSGTSGDDRQTLKYEFLDKFAETLQSIRDAGREFIICGDWNIAHTKKDLKNWRSNQKNSGFLPEERAWLDKVFNQLGFVDAFRVVNQEEEQYTWWSYRSQAWAKNVGWRIDYQIITPGLGPQVKHAEIYKGERFSDHAPLIVHYALEMA